MILKKVFLLFFFLSYSINIFGKGVFAGTKVWILDENEEVQFKEIEALKIGDFCCSLNLATGDIEPTKIIEIIKTKSPVVLLKVLNFNANQVQKIEQGVVFISQKSLLLSPKLNEDEISFFWKEAKTLQESSLLFRPTRPFPVAEGLLFMYEKINQEEEQECFCLKLEKNHNFFVTELGIIIHNFDAGSPGLAALAFGSGFASGGIFFGLCAVLGYFVVNSYLENRAAFEKELLEKQAQEKIKKDQDLQQKLSVQQKAAFEEEAKKPVLEKEKQDLILKKESKGSDQIIDGGAPPPPGGGKKPEDEEEENKKSDKVKENKEKFNNSCDNCGTNNILNNVAMGSGIITSIKTIKDLVADSGDQNKSEEKINKLEGRIDELSKQVTQLNQNNKSSSVDDTKEKINNDNGDKKDIFEEPKTEKK